MKQEEGKSDGRTSTEEKTNSHGSTNIHPPRSIFVLKIMALKFWLPAIKIGDEENWQNQCLLQTLNLSQQTKRKKATS